MYVEHRPPTGRYRGRRRVCTPPRSRYAAVVTTAFVGAGVVALGAGAAVPDAKVGPTPYELDSADLRRALDAERASRDHRSGPATSMGQPAPNIWLLPVRDYNLASMFGPRWGRLHAGVDLGKPEGTPYYAAHAGTVVLARWNSGYGYCIIIDHGNGVETVYGHSSRILVREGQHVQAGDLIGLIGNTGYSFGPHLHFEVHINGSPTDPVNWLRQRGVDIRRQTDAIYS
ncbi:MAG TPA: peptidoglycan DD-metalloendopeptidase family protein [Micromonosporaceae bacterium]|nr:peptidoglycan DD-metalloendopeptidase family protein [Micromonosporaceae bacterium]